MFHFFEGKRMLNSNGLAHDEGRKFMSHSKIFGIFHSTEFEE